jgi:hypothetical protein
MNRETVILILTKDLNTMKVCSKIVLNEHCGKQVKWKIEICLDLSGQLSEETDFWGEKMTGQQTRVFKYGPETNQQASNRKVPSARLYISAWLWPLILTFTLFIYTVKVRLSGNSSIGKAALAAYFHRAHYNSLWL